MMNSMHELAVVWIWLITKKRGLTFAFWISDRDYKGASDNEETLR